MTSILPAAEPAAVEDQARARAACGVARAWQQGRRLAQLLTEHDVPRPEAVWSTVYTDPPRIAGYTEVRARMASAADLIALAGRSRLPLGAVDSSAPDTAHAYVSSGPPSAEITAYWAGPLSTVESER